MRCVGKTTLGSAVARRMNIPFVDTDVYFEEEYNSTPGEYIAQYGLQAFRKAEHYCIRECIQSLEMYSMLSIVSAGGGIITEMKNRELLSRYTTIFLWSPLGVLTRRMVADTTRPMLTDASSVEEEYAILWQKRQAWYLHNTHFLNVYMDMTQAIMKLEDYINMFALS